MKSNLLSFTALAPVVFLNNVTSPALKVITKLPDALLSDLHIYHLLDRNFLSTHIGSLFCGWFKFACTDFLTVFAGIFIQILYIFLKNKNKIRKK